VERDLPALKRILYQGTVENIHFSRILRGFSVTSTLKVQENRSFPSLGGPKMALFEVWLRKLSPVPEAGWRVG
jgi:hypothetical protein